MYSNEARIYYIIFLRIEKKQKFKQKRSNLGWVDESKKGGVTLPESNWDLLLVSCRATHTVWHKGTQASGGIPHLPQNVTPPLSLLHAPVLSAPHSHRLIYCGKAVLFRERKKGAKYK